MKYSITRQIPFLIMVCFAVIAIYYASFQYYCNERFMYCWNQQFTDKPECGVYYVDYWEYPIQARIIDTLLSFVRCEGVM